MYGVGELETEIGTAIRRVRILKGLSLEEAAARANLSQTAVRNLELGRGSTLRTMIKLLTVVGETRLFTEWVEGTGGFSPIAVFREAENKNAYAKRVSRKRSAAGQGDCKEYYGF